MRHQNGLNLKHTNEDKVKMIKIIKTLNDAFNTKAFSAGWMNRQVRDTKHSIVACVYGYWMIVMTDPSLKEREGFEDLKAFLLETYPELYLTFGTIGDSYYMMDLVRQVTPLWYANSPAITKKYGSIEEWEQRGKLVKMKIFDGWIYIDDLDIEGTLKSYRRLGIKVSVMQ